ncbi:hypothetical protein HBNCFIEN_00922 [Legionella sp. PC997]|nr:hypothetical protein HBNCFIEN_00922 [Legionella sp. PC997]
MFSKHLNLIERYNEVSLEFIIKNCTKNISLPLKDNLQHIELLHGCHYRLK